MIVIVNYGVGNLSSVQNMLKRVGAEVVISSDAQVIEVADKLILPGVGHFDYGMKKLRGSGLISPLENAVLGRKTPILGICLGAQILGQNSEEGVEPGLGWLDMVCQKFPDLSDHPVPHMSWNGLRHLKVNPFFDGELEDSRYYFVHSYFMKCASQQHVISESYYGSDFAAVVGEGNITGMQFHPEKSLKFGMNVLKNFSALKNQEAAL